LHQRSMVSGLRKWIARTVDTDVASVTIRVLFGIADLSCLLHDRELGLFTHVSVLTQTGDAK
jgi:hypothetical protein